MGTIVRISDRRTFQVERLGDGTVRVRLPAPPASRHGGRHGDPNKGNKGKVRIAAVERLAGGLIRVTWLDRAPAGRQGGGTSFVFHPESRRGDKGVLRWRGRPIPYSLGETPSGTGRDADTDAENVVRCQMPGLLVRIAVAPGEQVAAGAVVAVVEAMKMQNEIRARTGGRVEAVLAAPGATIEAGAPILRLAPA